MPVVPCSLPAPAILEPAHPLSTRQESKLHASMETAGVGDGGLWHAQKEGE